MTAVSQPAPLARPVRAALLPVAPSLVRTAVLVASAAVLAVSWWRRGAGLPATWQLPPAEVLWLLPGAPVVGLLALRALLGRRRDDAGGQHLLTAACRWAGLWALVTAVWVVATVTGLYGSGLAGVLGADNLLAVAGSSDEAGSRFTVLWVASLVALFGRRLGGGGEVVGLLALGLVALLAAVPAVPAGHAHGLAGHPVVLASTGLQVAGLALWLGGLLAVVHLGRPGRDGPQHTALQLARLGALTGAAALLVGTAAVAAGLVRPDRPAPVALAVAQLAGVALVTVVGVRHRRRTGGVAAAGPALLRLAVVAAELALMAATVLVGSALPVGLGG